MNTAEKLFLALADYAKKNPQLRFGQILFNVGYDLKSDNFIGTYKRDIFYLTDYLANEMWMNYLKQNHMFSDEKMYSKLCYVSKAFDEDDEYFTFPKDTFDLFFTTKELTNQWGDDWDDAPYEHNAGRPYSPFRPDLDVKKRVESFPDSWNEDGSPKWKIFTLRLTIENGKLPHYGYHNSPYSVVDINKGGIPWLRSTHKSVFAGMTFKEIIEQSKDNNWVIYYE